MKHPQSRVLRLPVALLGSAMVMACALRLPPGSFTVTSLPAATPSASARPVKVEPPKSEALLVDPAFWGNVSGEAVALATPIRAALPPETTLVDVVADRRARVWLLGAEGTLDRLDGTRLTRVTRAICAPPRPAGNEDEQVWLMSRPRGFALYSSSEGLRVLMAHSGPTTKYFSSGLLDEGGRWHCELPPFLTGDAVLRSGGYVWVNSYGEVDPVFSERTFTPPTTPVVRTDVAVESLLASSPPAFYSAEKKELQRFDGLRWQVTRLEPPSEDAEGLILDAEGTPWAVVQGTETTPGGILRHDGHAWRLGVVPGVDRPRSIVPWGRNWAWVIGATHVALYAQGRFHVLGHGMANIDDQVVDEMGRLWLWNTEVVLGFTAEQAK